jgi:hypothetical protein
MRHRFAAELFLLTRLLDCISQNNFTDLEKMKYPIETIEKITEFQIDSMVNWMDIRFRLMNQKDSSKEFIFCFIPVWSFTISLWYVMFLFLIVALAGYNFLQLAFFIVITNN